MLVMQETQEMQGMQEMQDFDYFCHNSMVVYISEDQTAQRVSTEQIIFAQPREDTSIIETDMGKNPNSHRNG